ncbi:hypothetical protein Hypma_014441 [Hypsizygus marmoreus]|uniref:Uncharacterized protein n=1 Tax=Hypsizygus marmoreus TaxID=39966 RepID=A0A369JHX1_HYPMA|nr:hypothetical protein Hypma_014441 [Hypsizygus marmoreus]
MEELAAQHQKPVHKFYQLVGQSVATPKSLNQWNAYQVWYGVNGERKKPWDLTHAEWIKFVRQEYHDYLKSVLGDEWDDPKARATCLEPIVSWYKERLQEFVDEKKNNGKFGPIVTKVANKFVQLSSSVYEEYGIHVFGYAINTVPDQFGNTASSSWGGSPAYVTMRKEYDHTINVQIGDYNAMFRVAEMIQQGLDTSNQLFPVNHDRIGTESPRDRDKRVFAEYLRCDMGKILALCESGLSPTERRQLRMAWVDWANMAYEKKFCLRNWPVGAPLPGKGFELKDIHESIKISNSRRRAAVEDPENDDDQDYVHIVSWLEEDQQKAAVDRADIPLVIDADGTVLMTVLDSTKFLREDSKKKHSSTENINTTKVRVTMKTLVTPNMPDVNDLRSTHSTTTWLTIDTACHPHLVANTPHPQLTVTIPGLYLAMTVRHLHHVVNAHHLHLAVTIHHRLHVINTLLLHLAATTAQRHRLIVKDLYPQEDVLITILHVVTTHLIVTALQFRIEIIHLTSNTRDGKWT